MSSEILDELIDSIKQTENNTDRVSSYDIEDMSLYDIAVSLGSSTEIIRFDLDE